MTSISGEAQSTSTTFAPPIGQRERNNFDFLRFALAAAVIYSHSFSVVGQGGELFYRITHDQIDGGGLAVHGFFAISGYLITISWERSRGGLDFLRKRALRIFPGFVVMALVCAFLIAPRGTPDVLAFWRAQNWPSFARDVLTLHNFEFSGMYCGRPGGACMINASTWTIRFEFECYLIVLAMGLLGLLRRRWLVLALFGATLVLHAAALLDWSVLHRLPGGQRETLPTHARLAAYFVAGMVLALWRNEWAPRAPWTLAAAALLVVTSQVGGLQLVSPLAYTYLVFAAVFADRPDLHEFARHGDFSYGIYLYGWPVQHLLANTFVSMSPGLLTTTAFMGALALAAMSWHVVERPALSFKKARLASA